MSSGINVESVSAHALSNDLKSACGWCDQNGRYDTDIVSVSVSQLRKWAEMAVLLEMELQAIEVVGANDR